MEKTFQILEFNKIIEKLKEYSYTEYAKEKFDNLHPFLSEVKVISELQETTEARKILDNIGTPPLISIEEVKKLLTTANTGGMLTVVELEYIGNKLRGIKDLKKFLNRCKDLEVGMAYYAEELDDLSKIREEIEISVRDGYVNDEASSKLKDIRRSISLLEEKAKMKVESMLSVNKEIYAESYISHKSGHICLAVKKQYKSKIAGEVIDKSRTGETLFIEPHSIMPITTELQQMQIEENNEEIRILYTLSAMILEEHEVFEKNEKAIEHLDFAFAKGKLSMDLEAVCPTMNTNRDIYLKQARHPLLKKEDCIPLDFTMEKETKGILITGPNTGGKTVCIKTVGLLSLMAQCGLHVPCKEANICMHNQILADIGDGQNISENLSTFSSHIQNVLAILGKANEESLVILDELGSGTDPLEGMGIAIAILEELKKRNCIFIVTTHYPEVKLYAEKTEGFRNARMEFDKQTLKPLYKLEIGRAGESCALYIASKLGMPEEMIRRAYKESYGEESIDKIGFHFTEEQKEIKREKCIPKIEKKQEIKEKSERLLSFHIGDSVIVYPEGKLGIVCKKANDKGEILVFQRGEKILINHKRLKIKNTATELYPEDYDFSIIFDSVENRKKRKQMGKRHDASIEIEIEEED